MSAFIILVPNCPLYYLGAKLSSAKLSGAKLSGAKLSYNPGKHLVMCEHVEPVLDNIEAIEENKHCHNEHRL